MTRPAGWRRAAATTLLVLLLSGCGTTGSGQVLLHEDFNGPAGSMPDPKVWTAETGGGGWGNEEGQTYTARPENVQLDGQGHLVIIARREPYTGDDGIYREYTSARITTKDKFDFTYGRVEARIEAPSGQGLWPAFWLLGANVDEVGWPASGEVDVMEVFGADNRRHAAVHGPSGEPRGYSIDGASLTGIDLGSGFHDYVLEWTEGQITVSVDGRQILRARQGDLNEDQQWVFDRPMFLILNLAVGGTMPGWPDETTTLPATMRVDYITVTAA